MNFDNYLFRCSSLGYLMVEPKSKSNLEKLLDLVNEQTEKTSRLLSMQKTDGPGAAKLVDRLDAIKEQIKVLEKIKDEPNFSDSTKIHLADIYTSVKYGISETIMSKFLEKGIECEEDAITQYCLINNIFLRKNKDERSNGFIRGHIDIEEKEFIVDTKVNWSMIQFNRLKTKETNPLYIWQAKGYCILWKKPYGKISYQLINTPAKLLDAEEAKIVRSHVGSEEEIKNAISEMRKLHIFDHIPQEERHYERTVFLEEGDEEKIQKRVTDARKYLNSFKNL